MQHKNRSRILFLSFLLFVIAILAIALTPRFLDRSKMAQSAQTENKAQKIADLQAKLESIKDQNSQEYKETKQQWCALRARPATKREQAAKNVREYMHLVLYPAVSKEFEITFDCGRGEYEYYTSEGWQFIVDPVHDNIVEVGEAERRWGTNLDGSRWFDPVPEYDHTVRFNAEEAGNVAEKFLTEHKNLFNIDVSKMTKAYEGTKDGGGDKVNYFINWRTKDTNGKTIELVSITVTSGGQIVRFDNDTYDLAKN